MKEKINKPIIENGSDGIKRQSVMNVLKVGIVIIIIIFIFMIIRNAFIMITLSNKVQEYQKMDNYYARLYQYNGDDVTIIEEYNKGAQYLRKLQSKDSTTIEVYDNNKATCYLEQGGEKTAIIGTDNGKIMPINTVNYLSFTNNLKDLFLNSIFSKITSAECNGKECYYISNLKSSLQYGNNGSSSIYIEKETGLPVRATGGTIKSELGTIDTILDFYYEFKNIAKEQIQGPDITQYKIQE